MDMKKRISLIVTFLFILFCECKAQELVVGIYVGTPGELGQLIEKNGGIRISHLVLSGKINGTDIKALRDWIGHWDNRSLDLTTAEIIEGGEPYYANYRTEKDVIGPYMFHNCCLKHVELPRTLKRIDEHGMFIVGDSITFPPTLESIGEKAFFTNNFNRLQIPSTVKYIGNGAFWGNMRLVEGEITIDEDHPNYVMQDSVLYSRDKTRLLYYARPVSDKVRRFIVPSSVKTIDHGAFCAKNINHVYLPEGLEEIGDSAFLGAVDYYYRGNWDKNEPSRMTFKIPESVRKIGQAAFMYCMIDTLILPDRLTVLESRAFQSCHIESIHMPKYLKRIEQNALGNCQLYDLVLPEGLEYIGWGAFYELFVQGKLTIPSTVKEISSDAFWDLVTDTLEIKAPLETIPVNCFYNCQKLQKIILPPTIKRIEAAAFFNCARLEEINLPEGLESVGNYAFAGHKLDNWHLPSSLKRIENMAFAVSDGWGRTVYEDRPTPPSYCHVDAFAGINLAESVLYVPKGSAYYYKSKTPWNYFGQIIEQESTSISHQQSLPSMNPDKKFKLNGMHAGGNGRGLIIMHYPDGTSKKVIQ